MWWMILLLLMLAIAYVLWLRAKLDREWRLELAYLSRHVGAENTAPAQPEKPVAPLNKVGPNLTHWRAHAQASAANQAVWARVQAQLQQVNPRAKAAAALTEDDKARLASEETLAELPIFAQALPAAGADAVATDTETEAGAEALAGSVEAEADAGGDVPVEISERLADPEDPAPTPPAADLEVITLAEATRQVTGRTPEAPPPLEMVELNWPLPAARAEADTPAEPAEVITLADPALSRICARTEAERAALHHADAAARVVVPDTVAPALQTIGEDDIRANLLRQRLARRREAGSSVAAVAPAELAVIAEDEVLANLAKTDSPVNRQKHVFKRVTVRESVIPAAARIGHSHTVGLSPLAVPVASAADSGAAAPAPISTRFTPFDAPVAAVPAAEAEPSQPLLDFFADTEAAFSAAEADTEDEATPVSTPAEPVLHITDTPSWFIRDRLLNESAGGEAVTADLGLPENPQMPLAAASTAPESVLPWPPAGSAAVAAPLPPTPAWTPSAAPSWPGAEATPAADGSSPVWGAPSLSAAGSTMPAAEAVVAGDDAGPPWAEDDVPEWQRTLNQALAGAEETVWAPPPPSAAAAAVPPSPALAAVAPATPVWGNIQTNRLQLVAVPSPVPPQPAMAPPPAATAAGPHTAMGLALQAAMQQAAAVPSPPVATASAPLAARLPESWPLPGLDLLLPPQFNPEARQSEEALLENSITIEEKLAEFKVKVSVVDAYAGPVITRYEIEPAQGVRGNQVVNLEKDLARSLGFAAIRVVETIPGKTCMGLELPNPKRQVIRLSEIFNAPAFQESRSKLTLALGQDITGEPVVTDLARAPHLLVAGTTGSGKSVGVNAMILSMLFKASPEEVRLIMIDPKMLELSIYEGIPHLLAPVVTDMKLAANALTWCVNEMEKRYRLMSHLGVRNLAGFNQKVAEAAQRGHKLANPFSLTPDDPEPLEKLPFIVVVVDEFADLMMTAGKKIEELIARLAQKARAAGIHLILATQRPSVDVITGLIKANIPTRIAFQVSSKIDSRTILDQMGAENLLGQGDMLFLPPGTGYPRRVHGAFVADEEVHGVVEYLKQFGEPNYIDDILTAGVGEDDLFSNANGARSNEGEDDPLYDEAVAVVVKTRKASISSVQRQLRIGYNRAARLVEQMEADGIVSAAEGNGNRTVLAPSSSHLDE